VAHLAAAAGTPMLISDAGGLAAAADTPWSFRAGDAGGLAVALEAFFAAPAAPRGGTPIDAPDLPEIVDRTLALYEPAPPRQAPDRIASVAVA
jgi:hypothetical protein